MLKQNRLHRFAVLTTVIACIITTGSASAADDWALEEILKQLSELRRDYNELRDEVARLNATINKPASGEQRESLSLILGDDPAMGSGDAKVALVEFTDYQCPYCKRHFRSTMPKIRVEYIDTGKIRYVLKDYPLSFHQHAKPAAIAANCAGAQNKYWEMHDQLLLATRLDRQQFVTTARDLGLSETEFLVCLDDESQEGEINADFAEGSRIGIRGTPGFLIGRLENGEVKEGRLISGAQPFEAFAEIIEEALAR